MKRYKIYQSILCMITLTLVMSSCESFLEENPLDEKTTGQFWKTESDAVTGVNALYFGGVPYLHNIDVDGGWTPKATMWGGVMSGLFVDKRKDRTFTNASEGANFNVESFDATSQKMWTEFYIGISRANFVIANIPKMTDVLSETQIDDKEFAANRALANAVRYARDLCNEPANNLTPEIYAADIKRLDYLGIDVTVLDEAKLHDLGMDMLLSVAQGSVNSPRVAVLQWKGRKDAKEFDLGLVGKGVTFDSGGISLKPAANMGDMKGDMTGSAVVVAAIKAAALQKLPVNVVGVVGLVENMPSGSATRPGDIVRSMSGQTVEIVNTDAEGRLVLGDCLWYIQEKFGVKKIIDVATLTGSTMMTFGFEYAGLFANDDKLAAELTACGETSGEKLWRLPINAEYDKLMDSDIADMKNTGPRLAGGITAACFLQRFIKEGVKWAHLDIAGVDKDDKGHPLTPKGATGFGVRVLNCLLRKTK